MCMEDVKIARSQDAVNAQFSMVDGDQTAIAGANNYRSRLIVSMQAGATVQLYAGTDPASADTFWVLTVDHPNVVLRMEDWGEMIRWPWNAHCRDTAASLGVTDVTFREMR